VERVVLNALAKFAAFPPGICAFRKSSGIVFGEADPPGKFPLTIRTALKRSILSGK
jgi:hypothetical protein